MSTTTAKKSTRTRTAAKPREEGAAAKKAPAKPTTRKTATRAPKEQAAKVENIAKADKKVIPAKTLQEALLTGQAVLVKVRANGTIRSLPYLAPKSEVRETAVTIDARRQAGETIEAIAEDMNVSVATVRRYVTGLALAHEVEDGKHNRAWTKGEKTVVVHRVSAKA